MYEIGPKYAKASLESALVSDGIRESGKAWCKQPIKSLLLAGKVGRGKTFFLHGLMREIVEAFGFDIRFFRCKTLDDKLVELYKSYGDAGYFLDGIRKTRFLFLDDFGIERQTERAERDLFEIIDRRLEWESPTVITTNLEQEGVQTNYGKRILSRLKEYEWLRFDGPDLRGSKT